jgi:hypothetical protein
MRKFMFWNLSAFAVALVCELARPSLGWSMVAAQACFVGGMIVGRHVVRRP